MKKKDLQPRFIIEPLGRHHDRAAFCCGNESLDRYLKHQASQDARKNVAAPFVMLEQASSIVRGYYTLSMTGILFGELPEEVTRKLPRYPVTPAILLGRLAVDESCHGCGAGGVLLADALKRSLRNEVAWFAAVVDAIDENACAFYRHFGFIPLPDHPMKLFIMRKTIEQAFDSVE